MGAKLKASGENNFIILEKADGVGGTWRDNRYPGAECDIASVLYSYSFYPNPTWDFKWARQKQILSYLNSFTDDMGLRQHIRFRQKISDAHFDEDKKIWVVGSVSGQIYHAAFLIMALGQLHEPQVPNFNGQDLFEGPQFHTAQWPENIDVSGKKVAVIGNAASAIQAIPEIAQTAAHVTVYQRTANWIIPKRDRPYMRIEKAIARFLPGLSKLYRGFWFCVGEYFIFPIIKGRKLQSRLGMAMSRREMRRHIKDPKIRDSLTPGYPIGAKRILLSEKYYPALARANVDLVTSPITSLNKDGVETQAGNITHDIVIYATGFKTHPFYNNVSIRGVGGKTLNEKWGEGAFAYSGVATAGFPNLFMLYGPNTNSGHTSIVFKLESQVGYILKLLERSNGRVIQVSIEAETAYNNEMQQRLATTAWAKIDKSWYKQGDKIDLNWPGSALEYRRRMKTPIWQHYSFN